MGQFVGGSRVVGVVLAGLVVAGTTGCFGRGAKADFRLPPDQRPLEIPPALVADAPAASGAGPVMAPARPQAAPVQANGFTVAGERDAVYARVGTALEAIDGVQIASRAQLLGSYDVAYQGSNFLVRVVAVDAGAYVSAVDPRGLPATDAAATALMAQLQQALGG